MTSDPIGDHWNDVCDRAGLTRSDREWLWGRRFLNPFALEGHQACLANRTGTGLARFRGSQHEGEEVYPARDRSSGNTSFSTISKVRSGLVEAIWTAT